MPGVTARRLRSLGVNEAAWEMGGGVQAEPTQPFLSDCSGCAGAKILSTCCLPAR